VALLLGLAAFAFIPVTTQQGVDFVVHTRQMPLYIKAMEFIDRNANYGALAGRLAVGKTTNLERVLAILEWTRANVRDVPPGLPVIDDHVWHIVIRGYGTDDQKADVFTTLAVYAGLAAYWVYLDRDGVKLPISLVRLGSQWRVFDVANGLVLKNRAGEPASIPISPTRTGAIASAPSTRSGKAVSSPLAPLSGLQKEFAKLVGVRHALAVNSGTADLRSAETSPALRGDATARPPATHDGWRRARHPEPLRA
jgi:hypothetical protein